MLQRDSCLLMYLGLEHSTFHYLGENNYFSRRNWLHIGIPHAQNHFEPALPKASVVKDCDTCRLKSNSYVIMIIPRENHDIAKCLKYAKKNITAD